MFLPIVFASAAVAHAIKIAHGNSDQALELLLNGIEAPGSGRAPVECLDSSDADSCIEDDAVSNERFRRVPQYKRARQDESEAAVEGGDCSPCDGARKHLVAARQSPLMKLPIPTLSHQDLRAARLKYFGQPQSGTSSVERSLDERANSGSSTHALIFKGEWFSSRFDCISTSSRT
jgi:hypothetical protein